MNTTQEIIDFIKNGKNDLLEQLLEDAPSLADSKTEQDVSLLQFAVYCRNQRAVELLRQLKDIDIFEATCMGDLEGVKTLVSNQPELLNQCSGDGFTPLGFACFFGHYPIVKYLLDQGADVNKPSGNLFKVAPIHSACAISNREIVALLLQSGADVNAKQIEGVTPLHAVAHNGQTGLAKLLIENGADVNARMDNGHTPLCMAYEKDFSETANLIIQYGGQ